MVVVTARDFTLAQVQEERDRWRTTPRGVRWRDLPDDEARATALLDACAGHFDTQTASELLSTMGAKKRFGGGLSGRHVGSVLADLGALNQVTGELWRCQDETTLLKRFEVALRRTSGGTTYSPKGGGRSLLSLLLYLQDRSRWPIWYETTERGLSVLHPEYPLGGDGPLMTHRTLERFQDYRRRALDVQGELRLDDVELDGFLKHMATVGKRRNLLVNYGEGWQRVQ